MTKQPDTAVEEQIKNYFDAYCNYGCDDKEQVAKTIQFVYTLIKRREEAVRKEERKKIMKEINLLIPEWIDNPSGKEVNIYTVGRRDERNSIRKAISELGDGKEEE